ncbi:alanyl aminopeptidase [Chitinivorax tropicus]|uniref:Aminopeptidase n=1 Tax=Chitinivorax tropicus TaxID=714531 RepID=A0A840MXD9_9PROT|nr:M1 family aminopeptidase [Chitinivorax tropicus]MBB5019821.1 alanyl aminopeptidase [Chitinivorax tropicus]
MKCLLAYGFTLSVLSLASGVTWADDVPMRLGESVTPKNYQLELTIVPDSEKHAGKIDIGLNINEPTHQIRMNAASINIKQGRLVMGTKTIKVDKVEPQGSDYVLLQFKEELQPGPAKLMLEFAGQVNRKDVYGVFAQKDGDDWYALTQFETTGARHAFPCFDEPGWKVPWQLTLNVKKQHLAVANTPVQAERDLGKGMKQIRFMTTKPLPSYLVAFGVGPFQVLDGGKVGSVPLRYIAPRGRAQEARYAKEHTPALLRGLEGYFGMPYPYEKLDSLVIPKTMMFSAMENPGLITYRASVLLARPHEETAQFKRRYISVAAHELAHQWFGNYVTMKWWDDIWLNESFASWMGSKIVAQLRPEWGADVENVRARRNAMMADRLPSTRKIHQPVLSQHDLGNAFDAISYSKGQAVLAMYEQWLGEDRFRQGVRHYMQKHAWSNASAGDFIDALATQDPQLAKSFESVIEQPGIPRMNVTLRCDPAPTLDLQQSRFVPKGTTLSADQRWSLPVCYSFADGVSKVRSCTVMDEPRYKVKLESNKPIETCPQWLQANPGGVGYYLPVYWPGGLVSLMDDPARLSAAEIIAGLDDANTLIRSGDLPIADALRLAQKFANHPRREVVESVIRVAQHAYEMIDSTQHALFARYVQQSLGTRARALGFNRKANEPEDDELLRVALVPFVAEAGLDGTLREEAGRLAKQWLGDRKSVDASVAPQALKIAAMSGGPALFDALVDAAGKTKHLGERMQMLEALGTFRDPALLDKAFKVALDSQFDARESITLVESAAASPATADAAWAFMKGQFEPLMARLPKDFAASVPSFFHANCQAKLRNELESFFKDRIGQYEGGPRLLSQALERADMCIATRETQASSLSAFLSGYQMRMTQ